MGQMPAKAVFVEGQVSMWAGGKCPVTLQSAAHAAAGTVTARLHCSLAPVIFSSK